MEFKNNGFLPDMEPFVGDSAATNSKELLNAYIYDFLLKSGFNSSANAFIKEANVPIVKNDEKIVDKSVFFLENPNGFLPKPKMTMDSPQGFIYEWWQVFWDIFNASTNRGSSTGASQYYRLVNQKQRMESSFPNGNNLNNTANVNGLPAGPIQGSHPSQMNGVPGQSPMNGPMNGPMNNPQAAAGFPNSAGNWNQRKPNDLYLQQQQQQQQHQQQQQQHRSQVSPHVQQQQQQQQQQPPHLQRPPSTLQSSQGTPYIQNPQLHQSMTAPPQAGPQQQSHSSPVPSQQGNPRLGSNARQTPTHLPEHAGPQQAQRPGQPPHMHQQQTAPPLQHPASQLQGPPQQPQQQFSQQQYPYNQQTFQQQQNQGVPRRTVNNASQQQPMMRNPNVQAQQQAQHQQYIQQRQQQPGPKRQRLESDMVSPSSSSAYAQQPPSQPQPQPQPQPHSQSHSQVQTPNNVSDVSLLPQNQQHQQYPLQSHAQMNLQQHSNGMPPQGQQQYMNMDTQNGFPNNKRPYPNNDVKEYGERLRAMESDNRRKLGNTANSATSMQNSAGAGQFSEFSTLLGQLSTPGVSDVSPSMKSPKPAGKNGNAPGNESHATGPNTNGKKVRRTKKSASVPATPKTPNNPPTPGGSRSALTPGGSTTSATTGPKRNRRKGGSSAATPLVKDEGPTPLESVTEGAEVVADEAEKPDNKRNNRKPKTNKKADNVDANPPNKLNEKPTLQASKNTGNTGKKSNALPPPAPPSGQQQQPTSVSNEQESDPNKGLNGFNMENDAPFLGDFNASEQFFDFGLYQGDDGSEMLPEFWGDPVDRNEMN